MKRVLSTLFCRFAAVSFLFLAQNISAKNEPSVTPEAALKRLKTGNEHFVKGKRRTLDYKVERSKVAASQSPMAVVVTCSDSRVPPEMIFDGSLGDIFTVRVAGNVADSVGIGSIEYAVEHLGPRLVVVMGHSSCGAVKAAVGGGEVPPNIASITRRIAPSVSRALAEKKTDAELLSRAIELNVSDQIHYIIDHSEIIRKMVAEQSLQISGGVYDLASGEVHWLGDKK